MKKTVLLICLLSIVNAFGQFAPNTLDYKKAKRFLKRLKPNNSYLTINNGTPATGYTGRFTKYGKRFEGNIYIINKAYTTQLTITHDKKYVLTKEEVQKLLNLVDSGVWTEDPKNKGYLISPKRQFTAIYNDEKDGQGLKLLVMRMLE